MQRGQSTSNTFYRNKYTILGRHKAVFPTRTSTKITEVAVLPVQLQQFNQKSRWKEQTEGNMTILRLTLWKYVNVIMFQGFKTLCWEPGAPRPADSGHCWLFGTHKREGIIRVSNDRKACPYRSALLERWGSQDKNGHQSRRLAWSFLIFSETNLHQSPLCVFTTESWAVRGKLAGHICRHELCQ